MKTLPHHLTAHLIEEEGRLRSEKPQMLFIFPTDHSVREVFETVTVYVGVEPVKVSKVKSGEFCIQFSDQSAAKKMMELDGVSSADNERPCIVKEVDQVFSVDQMFHF